MLLSLALAADPLPEVRAAVVQPAVETPGSVSFVGLAQVRGSGSNLGSTNPFLNGQIVGQLEGDNGSTVVEQGASWGVEQRVGGFASWKPMVLGDKVGLNGAFEIDFGWGDQAYAVGGNTGGGFGADQVNLQTRRLFVDLRPVDPVHVLVGLQLLTDSVNDPTRSTPDELFRSGGRFMVFGSEAAGLSAYGDHGSLRWRTGAFTLWEGGFAEQDDISLYVADVELRPAYATRVGLHAWHLRDRAGGSAGVLGSGPGSALSGLQGASQLDLRAPGQEFTPTLDADLTWLGLDAAYNPGLDLGRVGVHGVVLGNLGRLYVGELPDLAVRGSLVDVEGRVRWARGEGSVLRAELLRVSGGAPQNGSWSGFITGNSYGIVGAMYATHGCLLLHPDSLAINRQLSQWPDVSGQGQGMLSLSGTLGFDPIADRLTVSVGGGHAVVGSQSAQELNVRVVGEPWVYLRTGLAGAYLSRQGTDAWTVVGTLDWLVF